MPPKDRDTEIAALLPSVYRELRRIANANMARMPVGTTLQPTALVHEAWLRLGASAKASWQAARTSWQLQRKRCGTSSSIAPDSAARSASGLGETLYREGRARDAEPYLVNSYRTLVADEHADANAQATARERLVRFYTDRGQRGKLHALIDEACAGPSSAASSTNSASSSYRVL